MKVPCTYANCSKSFVSLHNLRRHVNTSHLQLRNYECDVCLSRFSSKQNLNIHKFKHRRDAPVEEPAQGTIEGRVECIPQLTTMVNLTSDPDLRPYTKVIRMYIYPTVRELPLLAKIQPRADDCAIGPLNVNAV